MTPAWSLQILNFVASFSLSSSTVLKESFLNKHGAVGCAPLSNRGSHFTVELQVGSPPQTFSVVADTGSDAVIVPSCICQQNGVCPKTDRCFTGTNRSSSFLVGRDPPVVMIMFGSGPISAVVASDVVQVGGVHANMTDGVLLMINQRLNFVSAFEGILGLGIPKNVTTTPRHPSAMRRQAQAMPKNPLSDIIKQVMGFDSSEGAPGLDVPPASEIALSPAANPQGAGAPAGSVQRVIPQAAGTPAGSAEPQDEEDNNQISQRSFLKTAGIERFGICFNEGKEGVLRMGLPKREQALGSMGKVHWGLGFRGMSVGSQTAPVKFCSDSNKTSEQTTACGAIPDSGTTLITGPADQVVTLLDEICDNWKRCKTNFTALEKAAAAAKKAAEDVYSLDPFNITVPRKAFILKGLLSDCSQWLHGPDALKELPSLHLHLEGAGKKVQTLELSPWAYIIERKDTGNSTHPVVNGSKTCDPAFGFMDYNTKDNGPVWILGTSLFYEYQVEYDLGAKPPSMFFTSVKRSPCGSCSNGAASFADSLSSEATFPRRVTGPYRTPEIDTTLPL